MVESLGLLKNMNLSSGSCLTLKSSQKVSYGYYWKNIAFAHKCGDVIFYSIKSSKKDRLGCRLFKTCL